VPWQITISNYRRRKTRARNAIANERDVAEALAFLHSHDKDLDVFYYASDVPLKPLQALRLLINIFSLQVESS